jgi:hypothetical protein
MTDISDARMDDIFNDLKYMTYCECYKCSSVHIMFYSSYGDEYTCKECYRTLNFNEMDREEDNFEIEWIKVKNYIKNHPSMKKVMEIFIVKIMKEDVRQDRIEELCNKLNTHNTLLGN